ncbi:hypothetical protein D3C72_2537040 [compost metagenome]
MVAMPGGLSALAAVMARIWRSIRRVVRLAALDRAVSLSASCMSSAASMYSSNRGGTWARAVGAINCDRQ